MEEKVKQFMETLKANEELAEKVFSKETAEEVQVVLKEAGYDFSVEEIMESREYVTKALEEKAEGELSDDDLENVAGGHSVGDVNVDCSGW
jgi:predicted ribosomally synthesized peptide with nif11-like leader